MINSVPADWDSTLQKRGGHFLQSSYWLSFQQSLGQKVQVVHEKEFQWGGYVVKGRGGISYLYVPYGPTLNDENSMHKALDSMRRAAQQLGCMFVRFDQVYNMSNSQMESFGLSLSGDVQPDTTHLLDLQQDTTTIKQRMSKTDRNLINRSEKNGTKYSISDKPQDIPLFLDLMLQTASYKAYKPKSRKYLEVQIEQLLAAGVAKIYFAQYDDKKVAAAVGVDWHDTRYYLHAGGDQMIIRRLPVARGLVWFMIKDAQKQCRSTFDFYGVSPSKDAKTHRLASISSFKRSFGGYDKRCGGTWDLPVQKNRYRLYRYLKSIL